MRRLLIVRSRVWLLVFVLSTVVLAECNNQPGETTSQRPPLRVLSARERLEEALHLAEQWRNDAELKDIQARVQGPMNVGPPYVDFTFESPRENRVKYYVTCLPGGCTGREFFVSTTSGWGAITFDDEMIDSIEAANIGYKAGGKRFANVQGVGMSVSLLRDNPRSVGSTVWLAYYALWDEPLYVVIDPYTGEVIRTE